MKRLDKRVAIITGGARGIGKATAHKFACEGAQTIIWDMNPDEGEATAQAIREQGQLAEFMQVNTTDMEGVKTAAAQVFDKYGAIDILINNAGITRDATLKKMTQENWQQVIDVNLSGVFYCTSAVSPYMTEKGYGRTVSASSVVGLYGNFGQTNYVATKAGVIGMTKVWARELGRKGVTANAIAPGFIATEMIDTIPEKVVEMVKGRTPIGRFGKPEEIANAYLWLSSEEASFVNGHVMSVDGGITI
jgi:3-oxoacyl-[acyl-carrier protein] reductase